MSNPYFTPDYTHPLQWIIALLVVICACDSIAVIFMLRLRRVNRREAMEAFSAPLVKGETVICGGTATKSKPPLPGEFIPVPTPAPAPPTKRLTEGYQPTGNEKMPTEIPSLVSGVVPKPEKQWLHRKSKRK